MLFKVIYTLGFCQTTYNYKATTSLIKLYKYCNCIFYIKGKHYKVSIKSWSKYAILGISRCIVYMIQSTCYYMDVGVSTGHMLWLPCHVPSLFLSQGNYPVLVPMHCPPWGTVVINSYNTLSWLCIWIVILQVGQSTGGGKSYHSK